MAKLVRGVGLAVALALVAVLAACGSGGSDPGDVDATGRRRQAVHELRDLGLTQDQASCMVDRLGADTVVEAADMATLAAGQPYQDAAKECLRG